MELACTVLPIPKAARDVKIQKIIPIHFSPNPFSSAYIGPPIISPEAFFVLYFTAIKASAYLVDIPSIPVSQHQNTAPGPPKATAVATPMILPVPMVAASDVANAPNWLTSPLAFLSLLKDSFIAFNKYSCGNLNFIVKNKCVPSSMIIIGHPHTNELISLNNSTILKRYYVYSWVAKITNNYIKPIFYV